MCALLLWLYVHASLTVFILFLCLTKKICLETLWASFPGVFPKIGKLEGVAEYINPPVSVNDPRLSDPVLSLGRRSADSDALVQCNACNELYKKKKTYKKHYHAFANAGVGNTSHFHVRGCTPPDPSTVKDYISSTYVHT